MHSICIAVFSDVMVGLWTCYSDMKVWFVQMWRTEYNSVALLNNVQKLIQVKCEAVEECMFRSDLM